jgi:hypothetical protein
MNNDTHEAIARYGELPTIMLYRERMEGVAALLNAGDVSGARTALHRAVQGANAQETICRSMLGMNAPASRTAIFPVDVVQLLSLSVRAEKALRSAGVSSLESLRNLTPKQLFRTYGVGRHTADEIIVERERALSDPEWLALAGEGSVDVSDGGKVIEMWPGAQDKRA